jgi:hypothetical protein
MGSPFMLKRELGYRVTPLEHHGSSTMPINIRKPPLFPKIYGRNNYSGFYRDRRKLRKVRAKKGMGHARRKLARLLSRKLKRK